MNLHKFKKKSNIQTNLLGDDRLFLIFKSFYRQFNLYFSFIHVYTIKIK